MSMNDQLELQNFLVDSSGHVKLTDFGLATGALNPKRIESLKIKVWLPPLPLLCKLTVLM